MQTSLSWETQVLHLAHEALESRSTPSRTTLDTRLLSAAYAACGEITRQNSRTFALASALLPSGKRRAVRALYAFCRTSDDLVDRAPGAASRRDLASWRVRSLSAHPGDDDLVALAWVNTRLSFSIPVRYAEQLLEGVASDLTHQGYASFEELAAYCYRVASTVGLMAMHIIGFSGPEAILYAVKLGIALQLTNILRDVGEDWRNGRVYLPQDELAAFGLTEADLASGKVTPQWRKFMRYQVGRARQLYAEAWPGIAMLSRDGRFAIAAAAGLYEGILDEIELADYDVFSRRAHLSFWKKLASLPGLWFRMQTLEDVTVWYLD
ncbi:MAG: squalene/phytoene synthase family protein [Anaerolineales bacterium]|jgi:phytoene synthase